MRYAVLILALLGVAATGYFGFVWYQDVQEHGKITELGGVLSGKGPEVKAMVDNRRLAAYGLMGAAVLGLVGGILAFLRTKYIPALLLILPAGAPAYFSTKALPKDLMRVGILCSPLLLAGLLSFLIRSKPKTAGAEAEEETQPKRGGKRGRAVEAEKEVAEHAGTEEEAEAAFAALEMEGAEAEATPAKGDKKKEVEDIDLETAAAAEEQVDLESAGALEEEPSSHEVVSAAAAEEEEAVAAAAVEEEEPETPRWTDKFVCPSCDTYLKSSAPLPVGKPFNCPRCREPVTITARA